MAPAKSKSNELKIVRVLDAPVAAVWDAWTDPEQVAKWWGPRGFSITTHSKDLRPGGKWIYTMHGPDGTNYPNTTHYCVVKEREALVYDHGASEGKPPLFRVSVYFKETNGKTTMDMTMTVSTPEALDEIRLIIKKANGNSTWDRLAEYVTKETSGKETFVINRTFDAPIERVFEMWTNPDHLGRWLPPAGAQAEFFRGNIKPGGSTFFCMTGLHGKMYGRADYLKIEKPNLIVYTQQFCDENQKVARHPMAPTWPETMLTMVELTAEGPEQTRVTVTWEPYGNVTAEEMETFIKARGGMTQGWTGSFDKLEAELG